MAMAIVHVLAAAFAALVPIALWGYAFSYLDSDRFNAGRFGLGILAGAASVVPIAFMPEIVSAVPAFGNVFASIEGLSAGSVTAFSMTLTFLAFLAGVCVIVLAAAFVMRAANFLSDSKNALRSLLSVSVCVPLLLLAAIALRGESTEPVVHIAGATLAGFSSIVLAYLVVGSVEEGGKHLGLY